VLLGEGTRLSYTSWFSTSLPPDCLSASLLAAAVLAASSTSTVGSRTGGGQLLSGPKRAGGRSVPVPDLQGTFGTDMSAWGWQRKP
jgi:hypothetical protein